MLLCSTLLLCFLKSRLCSTLTFFSSNLIRYNSVKRDCWTRNQVLLSSISRLWGGWGILIGGRFPSAFPRASRHCDNPTWCNLYRCSLYPFHYKLTVFVARDRASLVSCLLHVVTQQTPHIVIKVLSSITLQYRYRFCGYLFKFCLRETRIYAWLLFSYENHEIYNRDLKLLTSYLHNRKLGR